MILKGSQRGGGQNLAAHLMRTDDNEHVRLRELRGFTADDLKGAFKEAEAASLGTRCQQYLFSLSLNPPAHECVAVNVFEQAIERIEAELGLDGQPRAIVFHEKEGRRHAHCIWSRIDPETMTARPLAFFKRKLMDVARSLYLENGWAMPRGLADNSARSSTNFNLAEWQLAKRQGVDPRWLKSTVQTCWAGSDNTCAFQKSLEEYGFLLARGDRRSLVILDYTGELHALARALDLKTKEVRARLGDGNDLPGLEAAKNYLSDKIGPSLQRHIQDARLRLRKRLATLRHAKMQMTQRHREARERLDEQQAAEWQAETRARAARLPKGLRAIWQRITGQYQQTRSQNETEAAATQARHAGEQQALIDIQLDERRDLQGRFETLRQGQSAQLLALRQQVGEFLRSVEGDDPSKTAVERRSPAAKGGPASTNAEDHASMPSLEA